MDQNGNVLAGGNTLIEQEREKQAMLKSGQMTIFNITNLEVNTYWKRNPREITYNMAICMTNKCKTLPYLRSI